MIKDPLLEGMCDRLYIDVRKTRTWTNSSTLQRQRETPSLFEKQPNKVIVDSGNQKANHVTHKPPNPFEHNAYGVEALKTAKQPGHATIALTVTQRPPC